MTSGFQRRDLLRLAVCKELIDLDLERTPVTDAGLARLKGLDRLSILNLNQTAVTGTGAFVRPIDLGAQGGNVGYLDGSIRWKNFRAMEPHVASDVTSVVIGYW